MAKETNRGYYRLTKLCTIKMSY